MIQQLYIQNYALIKALDINPSKSFNTITGETGAGKSILLGAVGLLLGNRADTKVLLDNSEKCVVEAQFNIEKYETAAFFEEHDLDYDHLTTVRREISPSGKSRAFVNDTPVQLAILKELGQQLVDIHSQHQTLLLAKESFQLKIIDSFVDDKELLVSYKKLYSEYTLLDKEYSLLSEQANELKEQYDYNSFLLKELEELELIDGEQEELEELNKKVEGAEYIKVQLGQAYAALGGQEPSLVDGIYDVGNALGQIVKYSEVYEKLKSRLDNAFYELKDLANEIEQENDSLVYDPEEAERVKNRLSAIYSLQQKHKVLTIHELIKIQENLNISVDKSSDLDETLDTLRKQKEGKYDELLLSGEKLSKARSSILPNIEEGLTELLSQLGMEEASIKIVQEQVQPNNNGIDQLTILFSANKGIAPSDIKSVASGGEFSRLMFAIKYLLASKTAMPTIIFDEIDTGISGEISIRMGDMMKVMANHHQLLCITHLPQVAAKGDKHFFVFKENRGDRTASQIRELSSEDRVSHLAEMIGGTNASPHAYESAKELLR